MPGRTWLSAGFVLEEGLPFDVLDRIVGAMAEAARAAGVLLITGDTKVVERGKADGVFINTTGVGLRPAGFAPAPASARVGDAVIVSGPIGRHGIAIMTAREGLAFEAEITSDTAALTPLVERLRDRLGEAVHALRDPTRGGVASALNEIAAAAGIGVVLDEGALPIPDPVAAACEMLGFDPLYVANEGVLVAFVPEPLAEDAVEALRGHPLGQSGGADRARRRRPPGHGHSGNGASAGPASSTCCPGISCRGFAERRQISAGVAPCVCVGGEVEGPRSGASRGSAPSQYSPFAMMQYPVAANHTIAAPTKPVNESHHGLCTIDSTEAMEMLIPTAR